MYKTIVIGAGPAGISAAIQLKRLGIDVLVIEKEQIGGLIKNANLVENYLGFPQGISGSKFINLMIAQLEQYEILVKYENALNISHDNCFKVTTDEGVYESEYLICATGTKPNLLPFNINENVKDKVFYDVYKLRDSKHKQIAIIGAGDASFDYALNLSKANTVTILNKSEKIKAIDLLRQRVNENINISYFENITIQDIQKFNEKVTLNINGEPIMFDLVIAAIGRTQNDALLTKELKDNPKLFMIGDVKNGILRQTAIAVGDGLKAAHEIYQAV